MNCELERIFGGLADTVSSSEETEFVFTADMLPKPPAELQTEKLIVKQGTHFYESYTNARIEMLHFQARERTYKLLGLLFFAKVFRATPPEVRLI